jgi:tetratricopeptide (TPR) repeat protein
LIWKTGVVVLVAGYATALCAKEAKEIFKNTLRSTAWVIQPNGADAGSGTGWLASKKDKLLITNRHVVGNHADVIVIFPEFRHGRLIAERNHYVRAARRIAGKVLYTEAQRDLAVIQLATVPDETQEMKLAPQSPENGEEIHSIGNPGISHALWVYTHGRVRSVYLTEREGRTAREFHARVIESDAATNPGDSGGPVVNENGELVGVHVSMHRFGRLMSQSIDASEVKEFLVQVKGRMARWSAEACFRRGAYHQINRRFLLALAEYTEALRLDGAYLNARLARAHVYNLVRKYDEAIADCNKALELDPNSAIAYRERAYARGQQDDYNLALEDLDKALKLDPQDKVARGHHDRFGKAKK